MTDQLETALDPTLFGPVRAQAEVTRESIRRFALAAGITAPVHHDVAAARKAGHPDVLAPPYFFVSLGLSMDTGRPRSELSDGGIAIDDALAESKVVAGETRVEWLGSIFAGDRIEIERTFVDVEHKRGRSGPFAIYTFRRDYSRGGDLLVREIYARIAR
jgi:acyl dehydratase